MPGLPGQHLGGNGKEAVHRVMHAFLTAPFQIPDDAAVASVGHLVGGGRHEPDPFGGKAEFAHGDAHHLRVEALAHLGAAVVHLGGAVHVEEDEGAGLVVVGQREGYPELERRHREAPLDPRMGLVPCVHRGAPSREAGLLLDLLPDGLQAIVSDLLQKMGRVRLAAAPALRVAAPPHRLRRRPSLLAIRSTISSITSIPWGPPNPRNAVFDAHVRLRDEGRGCCRRGCSSCPGGRARSSTGWERSSDQPPSE